MWEKQVREAPILRSLIGRTVAWHRTHRLDLLVSAFTSPLQGKQSPRVRLTVFSLIIACITPHSATLTSRKPDMEHSSLPLLGWALSAPISMATSIQLVISPKEDGQAGFWKLPLYPCTIPTHIAQNPVCWEKEGHRSLLSILLGKFSKECFATPSTIVQRLVAVKLPDLIWSWVKLARWIKFVLCRLSIIPRTLVKVEGENQLHRTVFCPPHLPLHACTHICAHIHIQ